MRKKFVLSLVSIIIFSFFGYASAETNVYDWLQKDLGIEVPDFLSVTKDRVSTEDDIIPMGFENEDEEEEIFVGYIYPDGTESDIKKYIKVLEKSGFVKKIHEAEEQTLTTYEKHIDDGIITVYPSFVPDDGINLSGVRVEIVAELPTDAIEAYYRKLDNDSIVFNRGNYFNKIREIDLLRYPDKYSSSRVFFMRHVVEHVINPQKYLCRQSETKAWVIIDTTNSLNNPPNATIGDLVSVYGTFDYLDTLTFVDGTKIQVPVINSDRFIVNTMYPIVEEFKEGLFEILTNVPWDPPFKVSQIDDDTLKFITKTSSGIPIFLPINVDGYECMLFLKGNDGKQYKKVNSKEVEYIGSISDVYLSGKDEVNKVGGNLIITFAGEPTARK